MRLSLQAKILALVAGTATGLAAVILVSLSWVTGREVNRTVHGEVRSNGVVLAQFVRRRSETLSNQASLIAQQRDLAQIIGVHDGATAMDSAKNRYLQDSHGDAVVITDRDGVVLGATNGLMPGDRSLAQDPGVRAALDAPPLLPGKSSPPFAWTGVVERQNRLLLAASVPVYIGSYVWGTFTVYEAVKPSLARDLRDAIGSEVAFVSRGRVVGASLPLPPAIPTPQGTPRVVTLNEQRYFALYAPLPGTPSADGAGFVTLEPFDRAMHFYDRLREGLFGVTFVTLLVALLAGTTLARNLTRPLGGVVQAAQTLERGEWPARFEVSRQDEIGLLQSVFNRMTTALQDSQERLLALIDTDPLTGLDNHRRLHERLAQEARRSAKSGEALSLLLLDLDHFQQFNQQRGHAAGDQALQQVAQALRECLPEIAIMARYGGEEFAVLLPQHTISQAEELAEVVRTSVFALGWKREELPSLSLSAGCAEFGTHTSEAEGLLLAAELAVSRAKQLGRNRVCRFDSVPGADQTADPYQLHRFLKDESLATIQALAAAVDAKDPYTQGHSQRVAEYAAALSRFLGMSEADTEKIFTTGTLHDVGKIGVPDAILKKPGRLDDEERAIIETHPALGEVIVRKAPALAYTLPGVRHHHERWDGRGYPDGLAGEAIPYVGRLLAFADTFDAMTSDRPYRKGLSWEIALAEIERGAGTQFDPDLVTPFVTMMREFRLFARAA